MIINLKENAIVYNGPPFFSLSDDELRVLWLKCSDTLDSDSLQNLYLELRQRGIQRREN